MYKEEFAKLLENAKRLAGQRNVLVHGEWAFKKGGFEVIEKKAKQTGERQNRIAEHKELLSLCQRYNDLEVTIRMFISSAALSIARKTS